MMSEFEILEGVQLLVMTMSRDLTIRLCDRCRIRRQDYWRGKGHGTGTMRSACWKNDCMDISLLNTCVGE